MRGGAALALPALVAVLFAGCGGGGSEQSSDGGAQANDGFYGVISAEPLPGEAELA
jgi:hypothetical protein